MPVFQESCAEVSINFSKVNVLLKKKNFKVFLFLNFCVYNYFYFYYTFILFVSANTGTDGNYNSSRIIVSSNRTCVGFESLHSYKCNCKETTSWWAGAQGHFSSLTRATGENNFRFMKIETIFGLKKQNAKFLKF